MTLQTFRLGLLAAQTPATVWLAERLKLALKTIDSAFKTVDSAFKTVKRFINLQVCLHRRPYDNLHDLVADPCANHLQVCIKNDEFCSRNEDFCSRNDGFWIVNDEFCITQCPARRQPRPFHRPQHVAAAD